MGLIDCAETSATDNQSTLRNTPEEVRSQMECIYCALRSEYLYILQGKVPTLYEIQHTCIYEPAYVACKLVCRISTLHNERYILQGQNDKFVAL